MAGLSYRVENGITVPTNAETGEDVSGVIDVAVISPLNGLVTMTLTVYVQQANGEHCGASITPVGKGE